MQTFAKKLMFESKKIFKGKNIIYSNGYFRTVAQGTTLERVSLLCPAPLRKADT